MSAIIYIKPSYNKLGWGKTSNYHYSGMTTYIFTSLALQRVRADSMCSKWNMAYADDLFPGLTLRRQNVEIESVRQSYSMAARAKDQVERGAVG